MALHDPTHLYEGTIEGRPRRIAEAVSKWLQPNIVGVPAFLLLNTALLPDWTAYAIASFISILFILVVPGAIISYYSRKTGNRDGDVVRREDRIRPLAMGIAAYAAGCVCMWAAGAPDVSLVLMECYFVVTIAMTAVTLRWKASLHMCGLVGPTLSLCWAFWPWGLAMLLLFPLTAWSRYVLRKHTPAQLVGGTVIGAVLVLAMFRLLLRRRPAPP